MTARQAQVEHFLYEEAVAHQREFLHGFCQDGHRHAWSEAEAGLAECLRCAATRALHNF